MKRTFTAILGVFLALVTVLTSVPFTVSAQDSTELIGEVQGSMPDLRISIDSGYSLDTIHKDKDAKIRTKVSVSGAWDSSFNFSSLGAELKTRGNSTFDYMKKPYQIKFDSKTDMFGMGKAKKWVLLANYVDGSFIRNKIVFDIAEEMGMSYVCKSVFVNLYIDGDYKGVYQLIEKVEIGDSRVPLENDMGVMVEMESAKRVSEEEFWFTTAITGKPFVYKEYNTDFEDAPAEDVLAVRSYLEERINAIENELYNNGTDWAKVESLIDVDSFIQFYFINELCMNVDATLASTYFYIDGPDDVLHMGPLWDYDRAFGSYDYEKSGYEQGAEADFLKNIIDCSDEYRVEWFKMLFQYPEFVERVNEMYTESVSPAFDAKRINATIDAYEDVLYDSLMRNYVDEGWALFHNINTAEFFSNRTDATNYLNFTTNYLKNNIIDRIEYLNSAYGEHMPALFYQQNEGRTYSGGSMTDSANMTSFSASIDGDIDGEIKYSATGSGLSVKEGANGTEVKGTSIASLSISLEGNVANYYSIQYRGYYNGRWSNWRADGTVVGTRTTILTRIQMRLVEKAPVAVGNVEFSVPGVEPVSAVVGNRLILPDLPEGVEGWYLDSAFEGEGVTEITVSEGTTLIYGKISETELELGDLNGDGKVNSMDANALKRIMSGTVKATEAQTKAGDVNGDGQLNSMDANILARYNAGLIESLV